nr:hypothetical protein [Tanacetum cinerariifolium]
MHNDIMAAASKNRPLMLAIGRYAQWQSRFMRYVDTKSNKKELKQCIFDGPYVMTRVLVLTKPTTKIDSSDDIYSIVDACTTAKEMWIAIERLQQAPHGCHMADTWQPDPNHNLTRGNLTRHMWQSDMASTRLLANERLTRVHGDEKKATVRRVI